jgi:hypothetical protein
MNEVEPPALRVLDVPAGVSLSELHELLQVAIGWTDSHLHQFVADGVRYGTPDTDAFDDERDEAGVPLRALPARFTYLYDFGDGWEHEVELIGLGGDRPGVVSGDGACPPEDVGGPHGYADFLRVVADPEDPEHDHLKRWAGTWSARFDLVAADLLVQQTAGAVPQPVRLVLDLAADGVKLTPGGRLPRAFVRHVQERYPSWYPLGRPASIEDDLLPLAALHDVLRHVRLLRVRNGVVAPTRVAADDIEVIRRLRSWFGPADGFTSILTTDALALLAADGPSTPPDLAGRLLRLLGDRWVTSHGRPLDEAQTLSDLHSLRFVLLGLDLIEDAKGVWSAGPSARWLLPRATALADLWSAGSSADGPAVG